MLFSNIFAFLKPLSPNPHPEFSLTAVVLGLLIGCLICFTNLSLGLQSGWISMMSIQSALIGYLVSPLLPAPLTPQEVVVVQTTAVAMGTMPLAAGFVGILPSLTLLDETLDGSPPVNLNWLATIAWSCSVAFFGVFLSPPIRKQVIIDEQLPFPTGTATAQLISVLHDLPPPDTNIRRRTRETDVEEEPYHGIASNGRESPPSDIDEHHAEEESEVVKNEGWPDLIYSFSASALLAFSAYFFPVLFAIPLFGRYLAKEWLWFFTPSLSYVGQGIIMGFPTALSMNLGMVTGWAILSPLSKYAGWAPGNVGDMTNGARGWILWISLGIMCADSFVSLLPVVFEFLYNTLLPWRRGYTAIGSAQGKSNHEIETEDRLVPNRWVLNGLWISVSIGTILVWLVFGNGGIKPWATLLGYVFGAMLSVIGVRALGETDLNPVSGLGKISQLLFAWVQPGNVVANIIAGGVAEAGAQQAGDLMQDLKTGHLVHASPKAQFYGQLIGSSVSVFVTTTAYKLYTHTYPIPGPAFPAPMAYVWLSLARLLRNGQLPEKSPIFMAVFSVIFAFVSVFKTWATRHNRPYAKWIPSGVAFAIGFLNTPSFSIARLLGGALQYIYNRRYGKDGGDIRLIVIGSGFVLGEGVMSIITLVLRIIGIGTLACIGCGHGQCGGCPTTS